MKDSQPTVEHRPSVCPLDCPDTCSLNIELTDGQITDVRGSKSNPFTAGAICKKVMRSYAEFTQGADRLLYPLRRTGPRGSGQFERISWEEALELVHDGFTRAIAAHGSQTVLPLNYAGPHGELAGGSMDRRFFYKLGASRLDRKPLCAGVRSMAYSSLFGSAASMGPEQLAQSDLILIWGVNVTVSALHLTRHINAARKAGGRLVIIDPKRTKIAEQADLHLQVKPGTDVVLGLALAAELDRRGALDEAFLEKWALGADEYRANARQYDLPKAAEICGLALADLEQLTDWLVAARALVTATGVGPERGRSGGAGLRAAMSLNALLGQHGRPGAGVYGKPAALLPKTTARLQGDHMIDPDTRIINILDSAAAMLDRDRKIPVSAVMIYNHNPVAVHPDQGAMIKALSQEEVFTVGCDVVMTDSMAYCDVILPAASHFEFDDIYSAYGHTYVQRAAPVMAPLGESLPNTEIFRRLAARFGFEGAEFTATDAELMDQAFDLSDPRFEGGKLSDLPLDGALHLDLGAAGAAILCDTHGPATPSGKIELYSADLEARFGAGLPRYIAPTQDAAFTLVTPGSDKRINATFGNCALSDGPEELEIHPEDAVARGLVDGAEVEVFNARGAVQLVVKITDAMQPGVLYVAKGAWRRSSATGLTVNALIAASARTDIGDGAAYHETFVDLRPI
ncbi:Dimethyl sulfoxide reductase DmsA precursor [Tritonibacter multivorans]|uniref:Dimethyl sulfoxide reductase DmsA n=1 Tax=Tritonibacter multivorans TaxID=928856 RepID=A0A0P1G173_9RHOB|nr:molybdopterin-dependent oxidoreductase [Tritonibacter multivorans]MDA7419342.1 molybdopterin-dependent oxidoreductase [Tritonibacter multivorans]CUH75270.1 Dimethyl sulfoxide reductase DmsA precursor [Tritonibacter multivorans]SFD21883.1 Anaerobic selenocysteine-containing dehydrogenase [Tritonibacter multivorans]